MTLISSEGPVIVQRAGRKPCAKSSAAVFTLLRTGHRRWAPRRRPRAVTSCKDSGTIAPAFRFSSRFVGGARVNGGRELPEIINVVIPKSKASVLPDWGGDKTLGMRASRSNSVKVDY